MIMQCKCYKIYKGYIEFNLTQRRRQKASFPKESVENADLYRRVLNKIMTIHE